jgi:hypothetical protein
VICEGSCGGEAVVNDADEEVVHACEIIVKGRRARLGKRERIFMMI